MPNTAGTAPNLEDFPHLVADYTMEELAVVAELLDLETFPGARVSPDDLTLEAQEEALTSGTRSLVARQILEFAEDGSLIITPPHAAILLPVVQAKVVITVTQALGPRTDIRRISVINDLAVVQSSVYYGVHTHALFHSAEIIDRVIDFVGLAAAEEVQGAPHLMNTVEFEELVSIEHSDLTETNTSSTPTSSFSQALSARKSSTTVGCCWKDGEDVVGGELTWVDAGDEGIWVIEPTDPATTADPGEDDHVALARPVSGAWIASELSMYLAEGLGAGSR